MMDPSAYKSFTVSRGVTYKYYFKAPGTNKPFLLFVHGFPSTSFDWRHQITFFTNEGYGVIVPDMLGYGGTSKPTEPEAYASSLITKDLVEILDEEKAEKAVVVGHDWGSKFTARLANYYPDRFIAYAFLAVGYTAPTVGSPRVPFENLLAMTKQMAGYELFGYWKFFSELGADKIVEDHMDSFMSLLFGKDPKLFVTDFAPTGVFKSWLTEGKTTEIADYITQEEIKIQTDILKQGGMGGPLCYYKVMTSDIDHDDNQKISPANIPIQKPVFFGAALRDPVSLAPIQKQVVAKLCSNATVRDYDAGHWVMVEAHEQVNQDLLAWIQGLTSKL